MPISIKHLTYLKFTDFDANLPNLLERLARTPEDYTPPALPDDPFRPYVEQLRDFVVSELEVSLLNIHDLILLGAKDTPDSVQTKTPPPLPAAFKSRVLVVNPQESLTPPEREFDNFNAGFAAYEGRVLLLGEPGAGKTTTLLAFTREKANARLIHPAAPLPVYAPLSSWDGKTELSDWLASTIEVDATTLRREIDAKRALLILDGLDEMAVERLDPYKPDAEPRDFRIEILDKLKPLETAALVSCRVKDYDDIVGKAGEKIALNGAVTLQPLSDGQIHAYLHNQPELWDALQADDALLDMARTPLLLTLLAIGYRDSTPEERAQLRDLSASPGNLRDRIFEIYVQKRHEHEENRTGEKLSYTTKELTDRLGRAVVEMFTASFRLNDLLLAWRDFSDVDKGNLSELAVQLHLLRSAGVGRVSWAPEQPDEMRWRFLHLWLRDYFAFPCAMRLLRDKDAEIRNKGCLVLGRLNEPRAVEPLINALHDPEWDVRSNAAYGLGKIADPRAVNPLIGALSDVDSEVRKSAVDALRAMIDPHTVKMLIIALGHPDDEIRRAVSNILTNMVVDALGVDPLIAALSDDNHEIRRAVSNILTNIVVDAPSVDPLIATLNDPDGEVRKNAAFVLGKIADPRAVNPLIDALHDPEWDVRSNAAYGLGKTADPRAVNPLIDALHDPEWDVRSNAAYGLGKIADPRAVNPLIAALSDLDGEVRSNAAEALCEIADPRAVDPLIAALSDPNWQVCHNAIYALGEIADPRAVDPLIATLSDLDSYVRSNAAYALGKIADPRAVDPLIAALSDLDSYVRSNAAYALGKIADPRAVNSVCNLLLDTTKILSSEKDINRVCDRAAEALVRIGTPEAIAAVEEWSREQGDGNLPDG